MEIGERIRSMREQREITQEQLAKVLGVTDKAVSAWENGTRYPRMGAIEKMATFFGVRKSDLIENDVLDSVTIPVSTFDYVPVVSSVRAGKGGIAHEEFLGSEVAANLHCPAEHRYFIVHGDSMQPDIKPNDMALVHMQPDVESGELAVVIVDGEEGLIKRVQKHANALTLISINSEDYPPRVFIGTEMNTVKIWGKVVRIERKY